MVQFIVSHGVYFVVGGGAIVLGFIGGFVLGLNMGLGICERELGKLRAIHDTLTDRDEQGRFVRRENTQ